jgi:hypothetical protein
MCTPATFEVLCWHLPLPIHTFTTTPHPRTLCTPAAFEVLCWHLPPPTHTYLHPPPTHAPKQTQTTAHPHTHIRTSLTHPHPHPQPHQPTHPNKHKQPYTHSHTHTSAHPPPSQDHRNVFAVIAPPTSPCGCTQGRLCVYMKCVCMLTWLRVHVIMRVCACMYAHMYT